MKTSSKATKMVMSGGLFMNSSSSNESNSDDEKCHLPTVDLILSDNEKEDEEQIVVIRRNISKLKRQQATTSLQSPLSIRNTSSLESIDNGDDDNDDVMVSEQMTIKKTYQTINDIDHDLNRTSFNESERTDSGIGRDSGSSWRLSSYSESFYHCQQQQQQQHHEEVDKQQGICMSLNEMCVFVRI